MKKRLFALLIASILLSSSLIGCNTDSKGDASTSSSTQGTGTSDSSTAEATETSNLSPPGEFPIALEEETLEVLSTDAPYLSDFNDNAFTKWYAEHTNIKVTYTHVPAASKKEKVNLLIASGEYPDILMSSGLGTADEVIYGSQGLFLPLNELIETQGVYFKEVMKSYPDLEQGITTPDGKIYSLANINDAFHTHYKEKLWINEEWLETLELKTPTTTDEFYDVLMAFKTKDPNGNGQADEIPMMGSKDHKIYPHILNSFTHFDATATGVSGYLARNGETIEFTPTKDEYREGLRYLRKLVADGLLDPASFTQADEQFLQLGTSPDADLLGVTSGFVWWKSVGYAQDTANKRANHYPVLAPLKGPEGFQDTPRTGIAYSNSVLMITDKCASPELAMRWADGLYSEEVTMRAQMGIPQDNWDVAPEGSIGVNGEPAIWQLKREFEISDSARNVFPGNRTSDLRLGQMVDPEDPDALMGPEPRLYRETKEKMEPYAHEEYQVPLNMYFTEAESSPYARLKEQINTYTEENLVAFITGNKDIETDWDSYVAEFDKLDLTGYLGYVQTAYDRQYNS